VVRLPLKPNGTGGDIGLPSSDIAAGLRKAEAPSLSRLPARRRLPGSALAFQVDKNLLIEHN